jgi:hypothetical protein
VRIRSVFSHSAQAIAEGALISLLVVGLMAGTAFAGKGGGRAGGGGGGSLAVTLVTDLNGDGLRNWGDQVTFTVSASVPYPSVRLDCSVNGTDVYTHSAGFYPTYPWPQAQTFTLSSYVWTGGAADCTATLYYMNSKGASVTITTLAVPVGA